MASQHLVMAAWRPKALVREQDGIIVAEDVDLGRYVFACDCSLISIGLQPGEKSARTKNRLNGFSPDPGANTRLKPGANESGPEFSSVTTRRTALRFMARGGLGQLAS